MDDRLWQTVWERNLNPVERHDVAVAVWRRADPGDAFASLVGWELAHRWRARARNLAVVYLLWVAFWGALAWATTRDPDGPWGVPVTMTVLGVLALAGCGALRRRLRPIVDGRTDFRPAAPTPTESGLDA